MVRLHSKMLEYAAAKGWEQTYAGASPEELLHEQHVIIGTIRDALADEFNRRFQAGDYEIVSTDGSYRSDDYNPYDVYAVRWLSGGRVAKCIIPESGFESIYELKAQSVWLWDQAHEREAQDPK
jgi:hypothetical protein